MLGTEYAAPDLQSLAVERLGLRVLVLRPVDVGQAVHAIQRIWVLRTQHPPLDLQGRAEKRLRLLILALMPESASQVVQGVEGLWILRAPNPAFQIEGAFQLLLGFGVLREIFVCFSDGVPNRCLNLRLPLEFSLDAGGGPVQGGSHFYVGIGSGAGAGLLFRTGLRQQIVLQEIDHRIGRSRFLGRGLFGPPGDHRLSGTDNNACDKNQKHCRRPCHQSLVTPRKLLELIAGAGRPRHDRFMGKISANVRA